MTQSKPADTKHAAEYAKQKVLEMQYPLWKEESIPDLFNDDDDIELLKDRNYETLLEYDNLDEKQSYWQQARQREEAEIAKINFENFILRQQLEEEEEMRNHGPGEESKSSWPAQTGVS